MCFRASGVSAPIMRNAPRSSCDFKSSPMPPALLAKSAPRSGTNKITSRSGIDARFENSARRRSSTSPRSFAPAMMLPSSSCNSFARRRFSGTSPSNNLCANRRTIDALPLPASPIKSGWFFARRSRICKGAAPRNHARSRGRYPARWRANRPSRTSNPPLRSHRGAPS